MKRGHAVLARNVRVLGATLVLLGLTAGGCFGAGAMDILDKALKLHDGVKDYTAVVKVVADIPDMEMPQRTARVYVKRPDKVFVDSKGIVIVPKRALLFGDIGKDIKKDTKAVLAGKKTENGVTTYCIKLLPKDPEHAGAPGDQPRVLVWVNGARHTIERVRVTMGDKTLAGVDFAWQRSGDFWMPEKVNATITGAVTGTDQVASLSIAFSEYKINTGLTDAFFESKEQKQDGGRHRRRHNR